MKYSLFVALVVLSITAFSQNTLYYEDAETSFRTGLELLDKSHYAAARKEFENYLAEGTDEALVTSAKYYVAFCALGLYHQDGEKRIENFIEAHPDHPKAVTANYELGNFYYKEKNYKKAATYYEKVNLALVTEEQREETRFKLAYAQFSQRNFEDAITHFNVLKRANSPYTAAANYYAGYIEYERGEYAKAAIDLERAAKDEAYALVAPELLVKLYYKQDKYAELIKYGEQLIANKDERAVPSEVYLYLGDAYMKQKNTKTAIPFYKQYEASAGRMTRPVRYRIGYSYYIEQTFNKAIGHFKQVASDKDSIGVYASYYLGVMYLKEGNKLYAKTAFANARNNKINEALREEGAYQYAKVSYDLNATEEAVEAITFYKNTYPRGRHLDEMNDLLSEAYLNSSSYDLAITHLEDVGKLNRRQEGVFQKATYLKGAELFNMGNYREAIAYFKKSLKYKIDEQYNLQANLWVGEAYAVARRYEDARPYYQTVIGSNGDTKLRLQARYGLAYGYYNNKDYQKALVQFKAYIEGIRNERDKQFYNDAVVRLADCYYVTKDYNEALKQYKLVTTLSRADLDYAQYQMGLIYGIQGRLNEAVVYLDKVEALTRSRFVDDAIFQKGQLYLEKGDYQLAVKEFTTLIETKNSSKFVPYALLRRGSANYNQQKYESTIEDYTTILKEYSTHKVAGEVLLPLQEALNVVNRGAEFDAYLANYKKANPDKKGLEGVEFETAKNQYFSLNYKRAISSFEEFIANYPDHSQINEAKYYMAESYYRLRDYEPALELYNELFTLQGFDLRNRVTGRIAEIEYASGRYQNAIYFFRQLGELAGTKKEQYITWSGLMESYFYLGKYDSTKQYANTILESGNVHISSQNKAMLYLGKSAFAQGDYQAAEDDFMATLNNARDEYGAEAQYLLGQIYYNQKEHKKSIETLIALNDNFNAYTDWVGKGYLLLADNYLALDDSFQAIGTLKSIVSNFPDDFFKEKAAEKIKEIEAEQSQTDTDKEVLNDTLKIDN